MSCQRNGKEENKHEGLMVVGDIINIKVGSNIPADGILLSGMGLECDESGMTGESLACTKDTLENCIKKIKDLTEGGKDLNETTMKDIPSPVLLSGTFVKNGSGIFIVIAVGSISCVGKVLAELREKPTMTPLQKKLEGVADFIGKIGFYTAILTVFVLFLRYFISRISFSGWESTDVGLCFGFSGHQLCSRDYW